MDSPGPQQLFWGDSDLRAKFLAQVLLVWWGAGASRGGLTKKSGQPSGEGGVGQMCSILVRMMSSNLQKTTKGSPARLKNKEFTLQKVVALLLAMSSFCVQLRGGDCYRCSKVTSSTVHFRPLWKGGELGLKCTDFHSSKKKMDFLFPKTLHIFNLSIIRWLGMHAKICPFLIITCSKVTPWC